MTDESPRQFRLTWRDLTDRERLKRFRSLNLPEGVLFSPRSDKMEFSLPTLILPKALDVLLQAGYIHFNIDTFNEGGISNVGAEMARDMAPGDEPASDWI